jgi:hypothetical protein
MSNDGAAPRAAVSVSSARAEASRKNGAKSRGPKTPEGKARSAQNALKHGLRAQKHVVLPEEDVDDFAELEAAMIEELAPVGPLQTVLARRVAVAAWRLARADRLAAGTGLGPRSPTRRPTGRAVRGTELGGQRQPCPRHDPRRQRHAVVRDVAALSRRGDGRVLARAQDAQGAPGRAGGGAGRTGGRSSGLGRAWQQHHRRGAKRASPATKRTRTAQHSVRDDSMGNDRAAAAAHLA